MKETSPENRTVPFFALFAFVTSGILLVLPFPIINLEVVAWFALVPLLLSTLKLSGRNSFLCGYLTGIIWNSGLLPWMRVYHLLSLPVVFFILSFYPALFCLGLNRLLRNRNPLALIWVAPLLWTSLEYVRSLGFLGFPWMALGYSQYQQVCIIQIAEFTGVFGVSFLIVVVNSGIACCLLTLPQWRKSLKFIILTLAVLGPCIVWGNYVVKRPLEDLIQTGPRVSSTKVKQKPVRVALIQGNVSTESNWDKDRLAIMKRLSTFSFEAGLSEPDLIIWPETAVGENVEITLVMDSWLKKEICQVVTETGTYLLTGASYNSRGRDYNSAFLISPGCKLIDRYDKIHLVPAAEYFPFWRHSKLIGKLLSDAGDFTPGVRRTIFEIPGKGRFGVLICFEGVFGDLTRRFVKDGADFLINITNDAWSQSETSHYQHASMASFRAIENRLYFVRVGNSGVSRTINPYGRIERNLDAYKSGILLGEVHPRSKETFYTCYGDIFAKLVLSLTCLLFLATALRIRYRQQISSNTTNSSGVLRSTKLFCKALLGRSGGI